jgi:plasmid stability protein
MSQLTIPDLDDGTLARLRDRAARHGRTVEWEAKLILTQAVPATTDSPWTAINKLREQLAASGRLFPDSTDDVSEDRSR